MTLIQCAFLGSSLAELVSAPYYPLKPAASFDLLMPLTDPKVPRLCSATPLIIDFLVAFYTENDYLCYILFFYVSIFVIVVKLGLMLKPMPLPLVFFIFSSSAAISNFSSSYSFFLRSSSSISKVSLCYRAASTFFNSCSLASNSFCLSLLGNL